MIQLKTYMIDHANPHQFIFFFRKLPCLQIKYAILLFFFKPRQNICLIEFELHNLNQKSCYSPGIMVPNFFAPAVTQRMALHLMLLGNNVGGMLFCQKTHVFLSFQMVQPRSIVREAMALRLGVLLLHQFTHHSFIESLRCQVDVSKFSRWSHSFTKFQRRIVNLHLTKRCSPDSCSHLTKICHPHVNIICHEKHSIYLA